MKNIKINLKMLTIIGSVLLLLVTGVSFYLYYQSPKLFSSSGFAMSTYIDQQIYSKNTSVANKVISNAMTTLKSYEDRLSMYTIGSEISKINDNAGVSAVKVSEHTFSLIKRAVGYCEMSGGLFDITIAPVTKAWGVNSDNPRVPSQSELNALKKLINYKDIVLDEAAQTVMLKNKGQAIDLGAVAKGEACNVLRELYKSNGITTALLSIGGNIMVIGEKPNGKDYVIGVRDPRGTQNDAIGTVKLTNTTFSTSGDYERFFEKDGKYYHHIMDPKTAAPAETDLMSVTIISPDGAYADFLSTYLFLLGRDKALKKMDELSVGVIAVDKEYNVYLSESVKPIFSPAKNTRYTYHLTPETKVTD
ncbi:FAD:protein FMN transferase [Acetanaerobacterium elongatum]|uniref:FAD:protein FMN transferase n=1 Tax=Acetanaerobacterium elongatum TaxID=258515 RepID=UPI000B817E80|nr:FAD:protein FMN transferase [Acetanaerobacterium elongatum]